MSFKMEKDSNIGAVNDINNCMTIIFKDPNDKEFAFYMEEQTQEIWANADMISALYGRKTQTIYEHIGAIYQDGELDKMATTRDFRVVRFEGERKVNRAIDYYNIDMILSVGYRVNSKQAVAFRKWSTNILKSYLKDGYVINEDVLRRYPEKVDKLAGQIRAIRASEQHVYYKVRDCFKISASDYEPSSKQIKSFYAKLQDKFHYAITHLTAQQIKLDRSDYREQNAGLQNVAGKAPTTAEAQVAKNYLLEDELYRMFLLSEQFLIYAEMTALSKKQMTMSSLLVQMDKIIEANNLPVLHEYGNFVKSQAAEWVKGQMALYRKRIALETQGVNVDFDMLEEGEYDYLLETKH